MKLAEEVATFRPGDRVFSPVGGNGLAGYAEFALADLVNGVPLQPQLGLDIACMLAVAGVTASQILQETRRLQPGESVIARYGARPDLRNRSGPVPSVGSDFAGVADLGAAAGRKLSDSPAVIPSLQRGKIERGIFEEYGKKNLVCAAASCAGEPRVLRPLTLEMLR